jgi:hypothetical protein
VASAGSRVSATGPVTSSVDKTVHINLEN